MVEYDNDRGCWAVIAGCEGVGEGGEEEGWVGDLTVFLVRFVVDWLGGRLCTVTLVLSLAVMMVVLWIWSWVGRSEKTSSK